MATDHTASPPAFVGDVNLDGTLIGYDIGGGTLAWKRLYSEANSNLAWNAATSTVTNSNGTDAVLTIADDTNPGLMSVADKAILDSVGNASGYVLYDSGDASTTTKATAEANILNFARMIAALGAGGGTIDLPKDGVIYIGPWLPAIIQACTEYGLVTTGPPDKYNWARYVTINGNGCIMRAYTGADVDSGGPGEALVDLRDDVSFFDCVVNDLRIDGGTANTTGWDWIFAVNSPTRHYRTAFNNCKFYQNDGGGVWYLGPTTNTSLNNCYGLYSAGVGIYCDGLWNSSINNADVEQNDVGGIWVKGGAGLRQASQLHIDSPYVYEQRDDAGQITLDAVEGVIITNPTWLRIDFINGAKNNTVWDTNREATTTAEATFTTGAKNNYVFGPATNKTGDGAEINNYRGPIFGQAVSPYDFLTTFDVSTTFGSPGTADVRYDNATPASVTAIYLDDGAFGGRPIDAYLEDLAVGDTIRFELRTDASVYQMFRVNGLIDYNTDWYAIPVEHISGSVLPEDNAVLAVSVHHKGLSPKASTAQDLAIARGSVDGETLTVTNFYSDRSGPNYSLDYRWDDASTDTADGHLCIGSGTGRWIAQLPGNRIYAVWTGAKADGTTDDTAAIQDAIDLCAYGTTLWDIDWKCHTVVLSNGSYLTTDTIHLGYGDAFKTVHLISDNPTSAYVSGKGAIILPQFIDRPTINVQGGRKNVVDGINIEGSVTTADTFRSAETDETVWDAVYDTTVPSCGISIDAYGGADPGGTAGVDKYADATYPAGLGLTQWGKSATFSANIRNCRIRYFACGVVVSPSENNFGNADFVKVTDTQIAYCKFGVSSNESQNRMTTTRDCIITNCFSAFGAGVYGPGTCGDIRMTHTNFDRCGYGIWTEKLSWAGQIVMDNSRAEALGCIGRIVNDATSRKSVVIRDNKFGFLDDAANDDFDRPLHHLLCKRANLTFHGNLLSVGHSDYVSRTVFLIANSPYDATQSGYTLASGNAFQHTGTATRDQQTFGGELMAVFTGAGQGGPISYVESSANSPPLKHWQAVDDGQVQLIQSGFAHGGTGDYSGTMTVTTRYGYFQVDDYLALAPNDSTEAAWIFKITAVTTSTIALQQINDCDSGGVPRDAAAVQTALTSGATWMAVAGEWYEELHTWPWLAGVKMAAGSGETASLWVETDYYNDWTLNAPATGPPIAGREREYAAGEWQCASSDSEAVKAAAGVIITHYRCKQTDATNWKWIATIEAP